MFKSFTLFLLIYRLLYSYTVQGTWGVAALTIWEGRDTEKKNPTYVTLFILNYRHPAHTKNKLREMWKNSKHDGKHDDDDDDGDDFTMSQAMEVSGIITRPAAGLVSASGAPGELDLPHRLTKGALVAKIHETAVVQHTSL